jgi:hypothetical protein
MEEAIANAVKYDIMEKPKKAVPRMPICIVLEGLCQLSLDVFTRS